MVTSPLMSQGLRNFRLRRKDQTEKERSDWEKLQAQHPWLYLKTIEVKFTSFDDK